MFSYYIVLTKNKKEVRFFLAGIINENNTFTGIMHDYTGGGNFEECLVFEDKWIPITDIVLDMPLEWDDQVAIFDKLSPVTVAEIEDVMDKYLLFDTDTLNYVPQKGTEHLYENGVLMDNISMVIPYGLGNTIFCDGYEVIEHIDYSITKEVYSCHAAQ